ncbi:MAG: SdrD B-like domain-containing protein [Anaerolineae bacterium]
MNIKNFPNFKHRRHVSSKNSRVLGITTICSFILFGSLAPFLSGHRLSNISTGYAAPSAITGTVFKDINVNGINDSEPGVAGVTVTAYDSSGTTVGTTTTASNGSYSLNIATAGPYRLEFTGYPSHLSSTIAGAGSGTLVQFLPDGNASGVDAGLHNPAEYCESNPVYGVPCYTNGDPAHSSNLGEPAVAQLEYLDRSGLTAISKNSNLSMEKIGSVYGMAYDRNYGNLYMATLLKRHVGLGPNGIGAIYVQTDTLNSTAVELFYDFGADAGTVDDNATRFPGSGSGFGEVGACKLCDNVDADTFPQIGAAGFGDMEVSEDGSALHVVNLADRKVYSVDLPDGTAHTELPNAPWIIGDICGGTGVARPWALKNYNGSTYVGLICDGTSSSCTAAGGACADLTAHVYAFDGAAWTSQISFPLDYERSFYNATASNYWHRWALDYSTIKPYIDNQVDAQYPQPILADIEFDDDGSMVLGFLDRSSLQFGYAAPDPSDTADQISERYFSGGDVLRVGFTPGGTPTNHSTTYQLENNGTAYKADGTLLTGSSSKTPAGPGGREFYEDQWTGIGAGNKSDSTIGGLALKPGSNELMIVASDAFKYYGAGVMVHSNTDGSFLGGVQVYSSDSNASDGTPAKSGGLGDLEFFCSAATLEIGNRVWEDTNANGIQDPGEPGIEGMTLELYDSGDNLVGTAETDINGNYYFSDSNVAGGLLANSDYEIRMSTTQPTALAYSGVSPANIGGAADINDPSEFTNLRDSNGSLSGTTIVVEITTGRAGQNNHTYDIGLTTTPLSLGDLVWADTNNNGNLDGAEAGIPNVIVELYRRGNTAGTSTPVLTTTTTATGRYLFTGISAGQYFVHIPSSNFGGGQPLNGLFSSTPTQTDPNVEINEDNVLGGSGDDNGLNEALPTAYGTSSGIVTLSEAGEPTGEDVDTIDAGTPDGDSNLSVDFGFSNVSPPVVELGDLIWHDANNDGILNGGELGIPSVEVELYLDGQVPGTDSPLRTTTTDGDGYYAFSYLNPGSYFVYIPASEFGASEPLENRLSTIPTETNPNNDENEEGSGTGGGTGDDNGLNDPAPATNGIYSGVIVLDEATEPTGDNVNGEQVITADNSSNLTLDLGFFSPVSIGNFVWQDFNANGLQDEVGGAPISGRTVDLFLADGFTPATDIDGNPVPADVTDGSGEYGFSNLPPGDYVVRVSLPEGFTPSPGGDDPDVNPANNDSNGIASGTDYAVSTIVTLTSGGEPTNDGDTDPNSNLSVDFGLVPTPDLELNKTVDPADPVTGNETVTYTVSILNTGYVTLTGVTVTDTLPAGLTHVSGTTFVTYWDGAGNGGGGSGGGSTSYFVQDNFDTVAFNNNTGGATGNWTGPWVETNDDGNPDGPTNGDTGGANPTIYISEPGTWARSVCPLGSTNDCLDFELSTTGASSNPYIARGIDLSSATVATITYAYNNTGGTGDVIFEVTPHSNGTSAWETLATHPAGNGTESIVITDPDQLAANTQVRFFAVVNSGDDTAIDNFQIEWEEGAPAPPPAPAGYATEAGGDAPVLTASSTYTIPLGKYITITYQVTVDSPIGGGILQFLNEAEVGTTQMPPVTDTAVLPVNGAGDWGDLPDVYGTTSGASGANHPLDGVTFLGSSVDAETTGVPTDDAFGDDNALSPDDENGIRFITPIIAGEPFTIEVTAGGPGFLNAWIDYDANGSFAGEQITNNQSLAAGVHTLSFTAPAGTTDDSTIYSRFRFSNAAEGSPSPTGTGNPGEVEDYALVAIGDTVWFDINADASQDGGAEIGIPGVVVNLLDRFGNAVTDANGDPIQDTTDGTGNYGFAGLNEGEYIVELDASNWTGGGVFATGTYAGAVGTPTQGSDDADNTDDNGNNDLGGLATGIRSGVIDLALGAETSNNSNADLSVDFGVFVPNEYGDLPDIYKTTLASGGAAHVDDGSTRLGATIDQDSDGVPTDDAEGDDDATGDDEDGITFLTPLVPGERAIIEVIAGSNGFLHSWIDFDADGTLDSVNLAAVNGTPTGGSINDLNLTAGTYTMTILVPATTTLTDTIYSRFRFTADDTNGALGTAGIWPNGEVEDYALGTIGDVVWFDVDHAGDQDPAEEKLSNVVVNLLDGAGNPVLNGDSDPVQTTTDSNGNYYFSGLPEGNYIVELDYSNWEAGSQFGPGAQYEGAVSTTGSGSDDNNNADDNGAGADTPVLITDTIRSTVINLDLGAELAVDGDSNSNSDLTIDFGLFVQQYDYGDLPNNYQTTDSQGGPRHLQSSVTYLGAGVDTELDGIPTIDATGDDTYTTTASIGDDEDGIQFSPLSPGQTAIITVTAGTSGFLNGWFDFDADGTLDSVDVVSGPGAGGTLNEVSLTAGTYAIEISVPITTTSVDTIYSRFRFTDGTGQANSPIGTAPSGEIEDYALAAIGDTVWYDRDADGFQDAGEVGIENVLINLLDGSGNPILDADGDPIQTTTNMTGTYGFAGLPDGDYIIQIDQSNWTGSNVFGSTGSYANAYNVAGAGGGDGADDQDNTDDNGDNDTVVNPAGGVRSGVIDISLGNEPTDDGDGNENTDRTIDFGFFYNSYDRGDLPDGPYDTSNASTGPSHLIVGDVHLGLSVDAEEDGQPGAAATGDDTDGSDDEDGVLFFTPLAPGRPAEVRVYANSDGYLSSFIDYDADGTLDAVNYSSLNSVASAPTALNNVSLTKGWHTFFIDVPSTAVISDTIYSRFRFTSVSSGATTADGAAPDGEVEDYPLGSIGNRVWEDVNGNGTQDGVSEIGIPGVIVELWGVRDAAGNYITTTTSASGEYYFAGLPEDTYSVQIHEDNWLPGNVFGLGGSHEGWTGSVGRGGDDQVDTDDNGDNDEGVNLNNDPSVLSSPITLTLGTEIDSYKGVAPTIDVDFKDFTIDFGFHLIQFFDYGDLPDDDDTAGSPNSPGYNTNITTTLGARHVISAGLYLGSLVDNELDGQPSIDATGDNTITGTEGSGVGVGTANDEDGISFPSVIVSGSPMTQTFIAGETAVVTATVVHTGTGNAYVYGFIDWNGDGNFTGTGEAISQTVSSSASAQDIALTFNVPASADASQLLGGRFRLSTDTNLGADGSASNGEVEDYLVHVINTDYGDLPDADSVSGFATNSPNYNTNITSTTGAAHLIVPSLMIGAAVDGEADGQPTATANGDDTTGAPDDEDGITFPITITQNNTGVITATVLNTTGLTATLYSFIDWNGNGSFGDAGEVVTVTVPTGTNGNVLINFTAPDDAEINEELGARFRLSTDSGLTADGFATDGEVEDYLIQVELLTVEIGNRVWTENDGNGHLGDTGDSSTGVGSTVVTATSSSGVVFTDTTDANGYYTITVPANDTYTVTVDAPAGYDPSTVIKGDTDNNPSTNDNDNHDHTGAVVAVTTVDNYTIDFGFYQSVEIGNRVWTENDGNGHLGDAGDNSTGVGSTVVTATSSSGVVYTATTNAGGYYTITVPANDTYTVTVDAPAGYDPSTVIKGDTDNNPGTNDGDNHDHTGALVSVGTANNYTIDFGFYQSVLIGDQVWIEDDNNGLVAGSVITPVVNSIVTATSSSGVVYTDTTDAGGFYTITVPANDVYTVTVATPAGTVAAVPSGGLVSVDNNPGTNDETSHDGSGTVVTVTTVDNLTIDFGFFDPKPNIVVEKATNGDDADATAGPILTLGDPVTWTYQITNTGNVTLTTISLVDDVEGVISCSFTELAPFGGSGTCTETGLAQTGQYTNTATVTGTPEIGSSTPITDSDPSHYVVPSAPAIEVQKLTNGIDADATTGPELRLGDTVTWTYQIRNIGNITLTNITLDDDIEGAITCPSGDLTVGATRTCILTDTVTALGVYTNTAIVTGTSVISSTEVVTATDPSHYHVPTVEIGNQVWIEGDHDGLSATNLITPVVGTTVTAVASDGTVYTGITDSSGFYTITVQANDDYTVTVGTPTNTVPSVPITGTLSTDNDPNSNNGVSHNPAGTVVTVVTDDNYTIDFGFHEQVEIGNQVWIENDSDGVIGTNGGRPVTSTVVTAVGSDGLVYTATTNATGYYTISVPANSTYTVTVGTPVGTVVSPASGTPIGSDNDPDNNDEEAHNPAGTVVTVDTEDNYTIDFVFHEEVEIGNQVWFESDHDGIATTGVISPIVGTEVTAISSNGTVYTTTTDATGFYTITVPANDSYTVTVDIPTGVVVSVPAGGLVNTDNDPNSDNQISHDPTGTVVIVGTDDNHSIDFGFHEEVEIGNQVWIESDQDGDATTGTITPVNSTVVTAIGSDGAVYTATTDATGFYTITVPANDTFTVTVDTPADTAVSIPAGGLVGSDNDPNSDNQISHDPTGTIVAVGTIDNYTIDFGFHELVKIGNRVWVEDDGDGIATTGTITPVVGTTVTAISSNGTIYTATTDSSGFYTITVPANETYTLTVPIPPGAIVSPPPGGLIDIDTDPSTGDNNGHHPTGTTVIVTDEDNETIDFGFHYPPLRLGNLVWYDVNNNGQVDPGEPPLQGVVINLLDENGDPYLDPLTGIAMTTTTNISGTYLFEGLLPRTYIVEIAVENFDEPDNVLFGFISSLTNVTPDPTTDPDVDDSDNDDNGLNGPDPRIGGVRSEPITLEVGGEPSTDIGDEDGSYGDSESNLTVDFGFFELLSLGNQIWFDSDDNGNFDLGESPVPAGVILYLLDGDGNPVIDPLTNQPISTTTDIDGLYIFTHLIPGDYRVQIGQENFESGGPLEGYTSSTGNVDPDDDSDRDDNGGDTDDVLANGIVSDPISLSYNGETVGDEDGDGSVNTNLTVDFGLILIPTAVELISFTANRSGSNSIEIRWATGTEIDNFGFRLLRSSDSNLANAEQIHFEASDVTTGPGASYSYTDSDLEPGTYTYWLIDVETDGDETLNGPVTFTLTREFNIYLPMAGTGK